MANKRYELVLLGPERDAHQNALKGQVSELFTKIGLDFEMDATLLIGDGTVPDWGGFPVAVWFGGGAAPSALDLDLMREFLQRGFSLFPVVDDFAKYTAQVPGELHAINGQVWDPVRVASDVMRGFRLTRSLRQVFISYKRSECAGLAHQLFHELNERGFRVFLDTASVEAGAEFQKALWSRMADVDIIILLDSPKALSSEWVHKELNRAQDLRMGVVQLIWPNHKRTPGTEFSYPIELHAEDFVDGRHDQAGVLKEDKLEEIIGITEGQRIRSLSARRTSLVEELLEHVSGQGGTIYVHPMRNVDVLKNNVKIAEVIPFVGVPDSLSVYLHEIGRTHEPTIVVYNGLGVDEEWARHLVWLNGKASVTIHQVDDLGAYLGGVL